MKKIINGRMYNTDTANLLARWDNGYMYSDFKYTEESRYQKKTGELFLYGYGGGMSKYAVSFGDRKGGSETIIPVPYDKAKEWATDHLDADAYESIFGEVSEDDGKMAYVQIAVPAALLETAKRTAIKGGKTLSKYIEELMKEDNHDR